MFTTGQEFYQIDRFSFHFFLQFPKEEMEPVKTCSNQMKIAWKFNLKKNLAPLCKVALWRAKLITVISFLPVPLWISQNHLRGETKKLFALFDGPSA